MWSRLAVVGAFLVLMADSAAAVAADPPGRVGRLSLIEGTVSMRSPQPVDADNAADNATPELKDEWAPATLNYPVTSGNSLWTESGGRAELQVGPAEVRLNEQTELEVLRLDDRSVDLALHQGTANVHIGDTIPGGLLIDTPRGPVTLTRPGSYRIDVDTSNDNPADTVQVTAFDGEAKVSVETPERTDTHTVTRGQSLKLAGDPVQISLADARLTAFDDWARSRDPRAVAAARPTVVGQPVPQGSAGPTISPVSTQMTGYQDLAPYGSWAPAPNYGTVWYPTTVTPDWAPYRYGHWAYVAPWGWTWIDDAPWGFTPFHYGRWVRVGPRWAWWPGHRTVRPVYAPALVAFVGGNGWSVSIFGGGARPVGWVPLAPYEVYRPHYRTSATYIRNVNITTVNKTVIKNITVNNNNTEINRFTNRNAITAVSADNFARGRKVNDAKIDVSRKEIERAKVTTDVRAIRPAAVAVKADQPRPAVRKDDGRRAPNPAVMSREQERSDQRTGQRRDPAIERRNAAIQAAPKTAPKDTAATPQAQPRPSDGQVNGQSKGQAKDQAREERRTAPSERTQQREQPAQQAAPAPAAKEPAKEATREPKAAPQVQPQAQPQQQREQRPARDSSRDVPTREAPAREERRATSPQEREQQREQRREQARERRPEERSAVQPNQAQPQPRQQEQQQREQADRQRRDQAQDQQRRQDADVQQRRRQAEAQQRQQAEQQRAQADQQRRQQAEAQQRQQAEQQQRQAQDQQRRAQAEQQQRQQAEQQQRAQQDQQRRHQAEQQQRQVQDQQRRAQAEQQQRQQAEQQQRAQADQQRQQREQAQQQQQRQQQQEQARDEQRRRSPDNRPDNKRDRAG
jgi:hypothetical protein